MPLQFLPVPIGDAPYKCDSTLVQLHTASLVNDNRDFHPRSHAEVLSGELRIDPFVSLPFTRLLRSVIFSELSQSARGRFLSLSFSPVISESQVRVHSQITLT